MKNKSFHEYADFDRPEVSNFLFYPRAEDYSYNDTRGFTELTIPVDENASIGGMIYAAGKTNPTILFFHGNGEIAADYHDLGKAYNDLGINFLPVDYRGYGKSTGNPTASSMIKDSHAIFDFVKKYLGNNGFTGKFIVMGRSLGSASALEITSSYPDEINGLIIESGFAYALPLLRLIGVNTAALGLREEKGFRNIDKAKIYTGPTLIIHSEHDNIIPFRDGKALYEASTAKNKKLLMIPGADHNTIFYYGIAEYLGAVKELALGL